MTQKQILPSYFSYSIRIVLFVQPIRFHLVIDAKIKDLHRSTYNFFVELVHFSGFAISKIEN